MKRVHFARQGDPVPVQVRRPHVDADQTAPGVARPQQPGAGLHGGPVAARLLHDQAGDAAGAVAAGLDLAAVVVADAHEDIRRAVRRRLHDQKLVATHPLAPAGNAARGLGRQAKGVLAGIDHHEVIAQPVHLDE